VSTPWRITGPGPIVRLMTAIAAAAGFVCWTGAALLVGWQLGQSRHRRTK